MDKDMQVRRLLIWNRFWLTALVMCMVLGGGWLYLQKETSSIYELKASWSDEGLRLSCVGQGPYIVTHLIDWRTKTCAELAKPIVVFDSYGGRISLSEIKALAWRNTMNEPCEPPKQFSEVEVLYSLSLIAKKPEMH